MTTPYDIYPDVLKVLDLISAGHTRTSACDTVRIGVSTFLKYVEKTPELQDMLAEAEQRGYDAMAEALLQPDNHTVYGHQDPKMASVQQKAIMWFLEKKRPKEYGQKVTVAHEITADRAIIDALTRRANVSALPSPEATVIDVPFTTVTQEDEETVFLRSIGAL